ncbi:MAG: hypothetical protein IJB11_07530 [Oscillospiraceae bacterium]|nr:hypothetical protein [Oscillospiraceae bacterium]
MDYLYETHCHSAQGSRCARSSAAELVNAYHAAGYQGLVLTDHFVLGNTAVDITLPWTAQMQCYHEAYLDAVAAAQPLDFDVIFGIEHACKGNEYLCYGIDLDFLLAHPEIPELPLEDFVALCHRHSAMVVQAHPFRWAPPDTPLRLDILDGIEIYNAANHPDANRAAMAQAKGICTSGGDVHFAEDSRIGKAGIRLPYRIRSAQELANALKHHDHRPLIDSIPQSFTFRK